MSKAKPKSALASLLEQAKSQQSLDASVGVATHEEANERLDSIQNTLETKNKLPQLIEVDPHKCQLWQFSDRPNEELGDISALAKSMKEHGQQEPILIRNNTEKSNREYEVIFGNRRWRAAKEANIKLIAILKDVSDQEAALYQKEENENRKDLSDYARALNYKSQIDSGIFKSEFELSKKLDISRKTLNDIMAYVRIPEVLRDSIPNFRGLPRAMVVKLAVLSKDSKTLNLLIKIARKIGEKSITTQNIDTYLNMIMNNLEPKDAQSEITYVMSRGGYKIAKIKLLPNRSCTIQLDQRLTNKIEINNLKMKLEQLFTEYEF